MNWFYIVMSIAALLVSVYIIIVWSKQRQYKIDILNLKLFNEEYTLKLENLGVTVTFQPQTFISSNCFKRIISYGGILTISEQELLKLIKRKGDMFGIFIDLQKKTLEPRYERSGAEMYIASHKTPIINVGINTRMLPIITGYYIDYEKEEEANEK